MSDKINDRILSVINELFNGNSSAFSRAVSVKQPTLNTIIGERKSKPSYDVIYAISSAEALNISIDWLITGNGKMLKTVTPSSSVSNTVHGDVEGGFVGNGVLHNGNVIGDGNNVGIMPADCEKKLMRAQVEIEYLKKDIKNLKEQLKQAISDKEKALAMLDKALSK